MNREIKFRGKDYNGKWHYGLLPYKNQIREFTNHEFIDPSEIEDDTCVKTYATIEDISILSETLGQFVGILDKNDKEIYEGDIVKMYFCETDDNGYLLKEWTITGEVFYSNNLYGYRVLETIKLENGCEYEEHSLSPDIAVIGNVFDNPELLKGYKHD